MGEPRMTADDILEMVLPARIERANSNYVFNDGLEDRYVTGGCKDFYHIYLFVSRN